MLKVFKIVRRVWVALLVGVGFEHAYFSLDASSTGSLVVDLSFAYGALALGTLIGWHLEMRIQSWFEARKSQVRAERRRPSATASV